MIYDKLSNIGRYKGLSANLDCAIRYILENNLGELHLGKTVVDGDNVYINHFTYTTAAKQADSLFEDHAEYIDVHIITKGSEVILVEDTKKLKEFERRDAEDAVMYTGEGGIPFVVDTDMFLLVYPGEAHLPKLINEKPTVIDKVVFKIHI